MSVVQRMIIMVSGCVARALGMRVCAGCVGDGDQIVAEERFGDYSVCARCEKPKTSKDAALVIVEGET